MCSLKCHDISKRNCGILNQTDVCFLLNSNCCLLFREELNHALVEFMVDRATETSTVIE